MTHPSAGFCYLIARLPVHVLSPIPPFGMSIAGRVHYFTHIRSDTRFRPLHWRIVWLLPCAVVSSPA